MIDKNFNEAIQQFVLDYNKNNNTNYVAFHSMDDLIEIFEDTLLEEDALIREGREQEMKRIDMM